MDSAGYKETITLGKTRDGLFVKYPFDHRSNNRSVLAIGQSGSGKSTALFKMYSQLDKKVIELDYSNSSLSEKGPRSKCRRYNFGCNFSISPFVRRCNVYGIPESTIDYCKRITDLTTRAFQFGIRQKGYFYDAAREILDEQTSLDFCSILEKLQDNRAVAAQAVCQKLRYFADKGFFSNSSARSWDNIFSNDRNIQSISINLSMYPSDVRKALTEFMLDDLKEYLLQSGAGKHDFILLLDECQTLDFSVDSPTSFFLSQGRKFGCAVWMATQSPLFFKRSQLAQLYQAALTLNFKCSIEEQNAIVRKLANGSPKLTEKLHSMFLDLDRGECVASGRFLKPNGSLTEYTNIVISMSNY